MIPDAGFWQGKNVVLTGHTGFKGGWLALWLKRLGANVTGISLAPGTDPSLFEAADVADGMSSHFCDILDADAVNAIFRMAQPQIVFHLAAQPLVRASYRQPAHTFATNVMGTINVLEALRGVAQLRVAVIVTTDKVYRNVEQPYPYREGDVLGGYDPYSASKAASEIGVASYRDSFLAEDGVSVATARAGNVIGGGDWSEDRLLPDAMRAWQASQILEIRRPGAVRPWQHVLEPLSGYLILAERLWDRPELAGAFNFGPQTNEAATVKEVIDIAKEIYGSGGIAYGGGTEGPHEAGHLSLEIAKARSVLGFRPLWSLDEAVKRTVTWYRAHCDGKSARMLCERDIDAFEAAR